MKKSVIFILLLVLMINGIVAEKIDVQIKNTYSPGEKIKFKIISYDDNNNLISGEASYIIENYYTDVMQEGTVKLGDETDYLVPNDAVIGPWKITVKHNSFESSRLFNIGKLEKADIVLEADTLIIKNVGNVPYEKPVLIYIGEEHQTANVRLEVGETKKIKMTAPQGQYTIKVNDGSMENDLIFSKVSLTGNVIGLESGQSGNFWKSYPLVSLFLFVLLVLSIIVFGSRFFRSGVNLSNNKSK